MKTSRTFWIIALLLLIGLAASAQEQKSHSKSYEQGKLDARAAVQEGIYVIKTWGLVAPSIGGTVCGSFPSRDNFYESILKEEYGISYEASAGCIVSQDEVDYFTGYNDETRAAVAGKYGSGFLGKVRRQADEKFDHKYGEQEKACQKEQADFLKALKSLPARQPD
jgi:hypothetical protein